MVTARKTGNVVVVYLDEAGRPQNFSDYDAPPEFAFPYTMDEAQARATYGSELCFIEPAKRREPAPAPRLSEAQLREQMAKLDVPADVIERLVKQGQGNTTIIPNNEFKPNEEVKMVRQAAEAQELVIRELQIMFAKYEVAPASVKDELEHVVRFVLQVWPELESNIVKMKERATKPKFSL
jgi:hypothetical protein